MSEPLIVEWKSRFMSCIQFLQVSEALRIAASSGKLREWTRLITRSVVQSFESMGWQATAKGNRIEFLPIVRSEYLGLDVVAFAKKNTSWAFPRAVVELENSKDNKQVAYSLWKVLCVQAPLRVVFSYRAGTEESSRLVHYLNSQVVRSMELAAKVTLQGEVLVVVGNKGDVEPFPYGFFRWYRLADDRSQFVTI